MPLSSYFIAIWSRFTGYFHFQLIISSYSTKFLKCLIKYLEQRIEIKQNFTEPKNLDIWFLLQCRNIDMFLQRFFISVMETGTDARTQCQGFPMISSRKLFGNSFGNYKICYNIYQILFYLQLSSFKINFHCLERHFLLLGLSIHFINSLCEDVNYSSIYY